MYASMTLFTVQPGLRERMEKLGDKMVVSMGQIKGFKGLTCLMDLDTNEYGGIALWETKEDALASMDMTGTKLEEALSDVLIGSLSRRVFEVYEPKT